ncbi:unnamed protein product [Brassica oleracea]
MSNKQSFVFLNEVKPYKNNWRVHVKVLHSWKSNTKFGESLEVENFTLLPKGIRCIVHKEIFLLENGDLLRCLRFPLLEVNIEHQDIIGEVFELGRIQTVQVHDKDRKRLQFRMRDTNGLDVAGCLWGKYAEQFEEYIERGNDQMLICLIRFAKINIFRDWSWFYFGCNIHNTRAIKIGRSNPGTEKPLFRCEACHANVTNVSPKYKLHLFVKDDSESCKIMLLDTVAKTIVGNTAEELWNGSYDEINDPELLPESVHNICEKSFCFGVSISSDNVTNGADTFFASKVWTNDTMYHIESAAEPVSNIGTTSSTFSGGEVSMFNPNSRNSSEGVSTPFSKRKEDDAELKDITSTSKKLCTKSIKLEKAKND